MSKIIATLFSSVAFISIMIKVLLNSINCGMSDPVYILKISLFGALIFGVIGFYIGRIFEEGREAVDDGKIIVKEKDKDLLIDDILIYDVGIKPKNLEKKEEPSK